MIVIGNKSYEVLKDHRNGWNLEAFRERYSEVLDRYDYIVGDWGYNQLRLKGFYRDNHPKAAKDSTFSSMSDYINEYCNFGCAHFVLQKTKEQKDGKEQSNSKEPMEIRELPPRKPRVRGKRREVRKPCRRVLNQTRSTRTNASGAKQRNPDASHVILRMLRSPKRRKQSLPRSLILRLNSHNKKERSPVSQVAVLLF